MSGWGSRGPLTQAPCCRCPGRRVPRRSRCCCRPGASSWPSSWTRAALSWTASFPASQSPSPCEQGPARRCPPPGGASLVPMATWTWPSRLPFCGHQAPLLPLQDCSVREGGAEPPAAGDRGDRPLLGAPRGDKHRHPCGRCLPVGAPGARTAGGGGGHCSLWGSPALEPEWGAVVGPQGEESPWAPCGQSCACPCASPGASQVDKAPSP